MAAVRAAEDLSEDTVTPRRLILLLTLLPLLAVSAFVVARPAGAAPPTVIDHVRVGWLPDGLGGSSDFAYEYEDVGFASRVWESPTADGWRVDLTVDVLRGAALTDADALHDWWVAYEDRPAGDAVYRPTRVHGLPAWTGSGEVFWLLRPGLAVTVHLDPDRWPAHDLRHVARSVRDLRTGAVG